MSNSSLDRKIYSLFKRGVFEGSLTITGLMTISGGAALATNSMLVGVAGVSAALAVPASRVVGRLSSGAVAAIQITNAEIDAAAAIALTKMNWLPGIVMGAVTGIGLSMAPIAAAAGLKIHTHAATGAVYDYANEFKGESVKTSGFYDGLALDYQLNASGTSILRSIRATVQLNSGKSMTGTDYTSQSCLAAGVFSASVSGTINGAGVTVAGILGQIGSNNLGTLTTCKYMAAVWADWASLVELGTGVSAIILATVGEGAGAAIVDYGLLIKAPAGLITRGIDLTSGGFATSTDRSKSAISIGKRGSTAFDITMTNAGTAQHLDPVQFEIAILGVNPGATSTVNAIYQQITHATADMAALRLKNADWTIIVSKNLMDAYCVQTEIDVTATAGVSGQCAAISAAVQISGTGTLGEVQALYASVGGAGAFTSNEFTVGKFVLSATGKKAKALIELNIAAFASATAVIRVDGDGVPDSILDFTGLAGTVVNENNLAAPDKAGTIKVIMPSGGVAYINVYDGAPA